MIDETGRPASKELIEKTLRNVLGADWPPGAWVDHEPPGSSGWSTVTLLWADDTNCVGRDIEITSYYGLVEGCEELAEDIRRHYAENKPATCPECNDTGHVAGVFMAEGWPCSRCRPITGVKAEGTTSFNVPEVPDPLDEVRTQLPPGWGVKPGWGYDMAQLQAPDGREPDWVIFRTGQNPETIRAYVQAAARELGIPDPYETPAPKPCLGQFQWPAAAEVSIPMGTIVAGDHIYFPQGKYEAIITCDVARVWLTPEALIDREGRVVAVAVAVFEEDPA